ncbi:MAG: hypothetical protein H7255_05180 [Ramlibacter sp.]|nr:hypothetical protein [Ramlibacter sp.]
MQVTFHVRATSTQTFPFTPTSQDNAVPATAFTSSENKSPRRDTCWEHLIEAEQLAQIELLEVDDEHASEVAALCLKHASAHGPLVTRVLLMNPNVRGAAFDLLKAGTPCEPGQQKALALCFLNAGYRLPSKPLAREVMDFVRQREEADDAQWHGKRDKHGLYNERGRHLRVPYYYIGNGSNRSLENRNETLSCPTGEEFSCRHLQQAAAGTPNLTTKQFLEEISGGRVSSLDWAALENIYVNQTAQSPTINFTRHHFGALVQRIAQTLVIGQSQSFHVGWLNEESHSTRVFLRRKPDGRIWVGFYEPNVTGNIKHLSLLPEDLAELDLGSFCPDLVADMPQVLSMAVESRFLARACAGQFVDADPISQFYSLCQALADGNVPEMQKSLTHLGPGPWGFNRNATSQALATGFHHTLLNGHTPAVRSFMSSLAGLKRLRLTDAQLVVVLAARDERSYPGLYFASQGGHTKAVAAYMTGVRGMFSTSHAIAQFADYLEDKLEPHRPFVQDDNPVTRTAVMDGLRALRGDAARLAIEETHAQEHANEDRTESEVQEVV